MVQNRHSRTVQWLVWGMMAAVILAIGALYFIRDFSVGNALKLPFYSQVQPFSLTNQLGRTVGLDDLLGKIWVADIIFTRCAGPCPRMTRTMATLQTNLPPAVHFVTLTTDPENDTPPVMKSYSSKFGADPDRWHFLTGAKKEIAHLAADSLKLTALEKPGPEQTSDTDFFIHSTIFLLVDKHGRLRSTFESDDPAMLEKLKAAVEQLQREG